MRADPRIGRYRQPGVIRFSMLSATAFLAIVSVGCTTAPHLEMAASSGNSVGRGQLVIESDVELNDLEPLLAELVGLREQVLGTLRLPPADRPIFVRIFASPDQLGKLTRVHYPALADRRAYFVDDAGVLTVYASAGPRLAEDLRHEVTHGYIHSVVPKIPIWLDEGLAEYFEVDHLRRGWNAPHADLLRRELAVGSWRPDLARLERLRSVEQMTQIDYAESWAWVYFLLRPDSGQSALLQNHLALLQTGQPSPSFAAEMARRIYRPEQVLQDWLIQR